MAKNVDDDSVLHNKDVALLIATISTVGEWNPDFHKVAQHLGIAHGRTAQQKFKKLIESTNKYGLVNGKVVDLEDPDNASTPVAKKGRSKSTTSTPRSTAGRKRKTTKKDVSDEDDSDVEEGTLVKKAAKRTQRSTTKSVKAEVAESDDEDDEDGNGNGKPAEDKSGDDDEESSDKEDGD